MGPFLSLITEIGMSQETLKKVALATTAKPITLEVDINPINRLHKWAQDRGWLPVKKTIVLHGITLGTLIRVSEILLDVDTESFNLAEMPQSGFKSITKDGRNLARCVALCIHNKRSEPPEHLVEFILDNFTTSELFRTVGLVINQMDLMSFITTIVSIKGVNILERSSVTVSTARETSLQAGGIIAPGQPSEE